MAARTTQGVPVKFQDEQTVFVRAREGRLMKRSAIAVGGLLLALGLSAVSPTPGGAQPAAPAESAAVEPRPSWKA